MFFFLFSILVQKPNSIPERASRPLVISVTNDIVDYYIVDYYD